MNNNHEILESLFSKILSAFAKVFDRVEKEIIDPFSCGNIEEAKENIVAFGSKTSIEKLLFAIVRNFRAIVNLRCDLDKHYNCENDSEEFEITEAEIDQKFSDLFEDLRKLQQ